MLLALGVGGVFKSIMLVSFSDLFTAFILFLSPIPYPTTLYQAQSTWYMMSDPRSIFSQDPRYGAVRDICETLGYGSDEKSDPRFFHTVSRPATKFRLQFIDSSPSLASFPLVYTDPDVQLCSLDFLEKNQHLFNESAEALASGWPIYPRDSQRFVFRHTQRRDS